MGYAKKCRSRVTWTRCGSGSVYKAPDGHWRVRLCAGVQKNPSQNLAERYDVSLPDFVGTLLDDYVDEYRDILLDGHQSNYLFVPTRSSSIWTNIGRHVQDLTKKFIPGSAGFGTHAYRHLVATAWLTKHPGDFLTVAELLNDRLETVMQNYAHLKRDASFLRYGRHLSSLIDSTDQSV